MRKFKNCLIWHVRTGKNNLYILRTIAVTSLLTRFGQVIFYRKLCWLERSCFRPHCSGDKIGIINCFKQNVCFNRGWHRLRLSCSYAGRVDRSPFGIPDSPGKNWRFFIFVLFSVTFRTNSKIVICVLLL